MQVLDYNVPGGKLNRGMAVYDVLEAIKGPESDINLEWWHPRCGISESDAFKANALGWCVEWVSSKCQGQLCRPPGGGGRGGSDEDRIRGALVWRVNYRKGINCRG
eukprot:812399-Pelagomonas_calceolata.AAC.3